MTDPNTLAHWSVATVAEDALYRAIVERDAERARDALAEIEDALDAVEGGEE